LGNTEGALYIKVSMRLGLSLNVGIENLKKSEVKVKIYAYKRLEAVCKHTDTKMCVHTGISCCPSKVFVLPVSYMLVCPAISVFLS